MNDTSPQETTPASPAEESTATANDNQSQPSELEALRAEVASLKDQWIRAVAEADNIRKRSQKEIEDISKYAITGFARDMVSVLENLRRASDSIPVEQRTGNDLLKNLGEGVDLTMSELLGIFDRYGIKRIDPLNQKFDHNLHQAVAHIPDANVEPGTVMSVLQSGYVIHDRLLRPAMVTVSKAAEPIKSVDTSA